MFAVGVNKPAEAQAGWACPAPSPLRGRPGPRRPRCHPPRRRPGRGGGVPAGGCDRAFTRPSRAPRGEEQLQGLSLSPVPARNVGLFILGVSGVPWGLRLAPLRPHASRPVVRLRAKPRSPLLKGRAGDPPRRLRATLRRKAALRPCLDLLNQKLCEGGPATLSTPSAGHSTHARVREARSLAAGFPGAGFSGCCAGWSPGTGQVHDAHFTNEQIMDVEGPAKGCRLMSPLFLPTSSSLLLPDAAICPSREPRFVTGFCHPLAFLRALKSDEVRDGGRGWLSPEDALAIFPPQKDFLHIA